MSARATKKVLVTGGNGFLGSAVVEELAARGYEQIIKPRSSEYDLNDPGRVREMFERFQPELVLHLAARVGGIGANRRHPGTFFRENMLMGVFVLEEARRRRTEK